MYLMQLLNITLMDLIEKKEELYLAPEVSVLEIATETFICQSNPGETPGNLGGGGWI